MYSGSRAAVAGGVDQQVVAGSSDGTIEDGLQRLVARLAVLEAEVVAEDDEALRSLTHLIHDVRQIHQVCLVHLDQAQATRRKLVQARP